MTYTPIIRINDSNITIFQTLRGEQRVNIKDNELNIILNNSKAELTLL